MTFSAGKKCGMKFACSEIGEEAKHDVPVVHFLSLASLCHENNYTTRKYEKKRMLNKREIIKKKKKNRVKNINSIRKGPDLTALLKKLKL